MHVQIDAVVGMTSFLFTSFIVGSEVFGYDRPFIRTDNVISSRTLPEDHLLNTSVSWHIRTGVQETGVVFTDIDVKTDPDCLEYVAVCFV